MPCHRNFRLTRRSFCYTTPDLKAENLFQHRNFDSFYDLTCGTAPAAGPLNIVFTATGTDPVTWARSILCNPRFEICRLSRVYFCTDFFFYLIGLKRGSAVGPLNIVCTATGTIFFPPNWARDMLYNPRFEVGVFPGSGACRSILFLVKSLHNSCNHRPHSDFNFLPTTM
jgi:hypothetical protein